MPNPKPNQPRSDPHGGHTTQPYWNRAHRDWRVWVGVIVMLAAIIIFIVTSNESMPLPTPSQLPPPAPAAK